MKMSKLGYFSEFLLFPPLVLLATLLAFRSSNPPQPAIWVLVYGIGLFGWTFIEYLLHRVLFHHAPVLSQIHERHHRSPLDLIGTPAWVSVLLGVITVAIPSWAAFGCWGVGGFGVVAEDALWSRNYFGVNAEIAVRGCHDRRINRPNTWLHRPMLQT
jgi:sterol desaturase/sphingolipid hydroxylase (fatty acid hydroxylase superfamily)